MVLTPIKPLVRETMEMQARLQRGNEQVSRKILGEQCDQQGITYSLSNVNSQADIICVVG